MTGVYVLQRPNRLMLVLAVVAAVIFMSPGVASADQQFFNEPCGEGQEVNIFGMSFSKFQIVVEIGTYNGQHYFHTERYGNPGEDYFAWEIGIKIGQVNSWERIVGLGFISDGAGWVGIECSDSDPDQEWQGPVYRG